MSLLLLRADASRDRGTGHVLRCLALAQAWQDAGGRAVLLTQGLHPRLAARLAAAGVPSQELTARPGTFGDATATAAVADALGASWVAADGYHFDAGWQERVVQAGHRLLFFDDNGHCGHYAAHLVVNQNAHATPAPYGQRAAHTALLLGPRFAVLRREFAAAAPGALAPGDRPARILVTLGGSDPRAHLERVVSAALPPPPGAALVGLVGSHHPRADAVAAALEGHPRASVVQDARDMARQLGQARLVVSAAGTTTYELAALGVPALLLAIADNQLQSARAVEELEAARFLGPVEGVSTEALRAALQALWADGDALDALSEAGRALVDGQGARRVVGRMRGLGRLSGAPLDLQRATWADRGALWSQANDPEVRARAFHPGRIPWSGHLQWLQVRLADPDTRLLRARLGAGPERGADVGTVRFDRIGPAEWEITVAVAAEQRGRGLGAGLIAAGCRALAADVGPDVAVLARIRADNAASLRSFAKAGFGAPRPTPMEGVDAVGCWWRPGG